MFRNLLILIFLWSQIMAQDILLYNKRMGLNIGANFAIGSHFQRIGFNANFYFIDNNFQANTEARFYINIKNLGPKKIYTEFVLAQGIVLGYGKKQNFFNPFFNSVSNQTKYKNCVAYSYNLYSNKIKTSQVTGIVNLQFGKISFITENDILAKQVLDRFRTGSFLLQYQHDSIVQVAINCTMWTGKMGQFTKIDNKEFYNKCYMDTTGGLYCNYSHGLLSLQTKINMGFGQNIQGNVGVDAEQVRNAVQNKFIHDLKFIPKKWNKAQNCHIPMLDTTGNAFLYLPNQKIKKPSFYWNVFSNANLFY